MSDLSKRPGYQESMTHPLRRAVCDLRAKHDLTGCVLITFSGDRVGVSSSGRTDEFGAHMVTLGDRILAAIDDGQFDPSESGSNTTLSARPGRSKAEIAVDLENASRRVAITSRSYMSALMLEAARTLSPPVRGGK